MDLYCQICNVNHEEESQVHNNSLKHRFNFLLLEWSKYRKALVHNRHGVVVKVTLERQNGHTYNFQDNTNKGKCTVKITPNHLLSHDNKLEFPCKLVNNRHDPIHITSCNILHNFPLFDIYDPGNNLENGKVLELQPGAEYTINVTFSCNDRVQIGQYTIPLSFTFQTTGTPPESFTIVRTIDVSVSEDIDEVEDLGQSPFKGNEWPAHVKLHMPTKVSWHFNTFLVPPVYQKCIRYGLQEWRNMSVEDTENLLVLREKMEPGHITPENYKNFWQVVLWLEEMGQMLGLQKFNMENVRLVCLGLGVFELEVPGLAEKRPSVIVGDMIDIRIHNDHTGYRGIIRKVNDKTVEIGDISEQLVMMIYQYPSTEVDVRFVLSRLGFQRMHQAVDQIVLLDKTNVLFPDVSLADREVRETRTVDTGDFHNRLITTNPEQKTAVLRIVNASCVPAPYIVFGPPGTGKTVTIVEAILQLKATTSKSILVCAPANAACDMLTEKLLKYCGKDELVRIMSDSSDKSTVKETVLEYSNVVEGMVYRIPAQQLRKYRIVVTTLILVGRYNGDYHPDVVFIDEAAQAFEPESACAIAMVKKGGLVVLAGDPRQLGPSLNSNVSKKYHLGVSLLERLMDLELYQSGNENYITMLRRNFRSHSNILRLPNELFYDGQLQAVSAGAQRDPLAKVLVFDEILGGFNKRGSRGRHGEAVEFCSVISKESREGRSPSYFNQVEMLMVLRYVKALTSLHFDDVNDTVLPEQIGVVTPYVRQVHKIRDLLRQNHFEGVEVGTTETFQGREKRVILISTVRAQKDLLLYDKKYNLGFVRNEKRFNVAVTRAMSKLVVIGCAHVLGTDRNWLNFIEMCEELQTFCNAPHVRRTNDVINDITSRFRGIQMLDSQHNH